MDPEFGLLYYLVGSRQKTMNDFESKSNREQHANDKAECIRLS